MSKKSSSNESFNDYVIRLRPFQYVHLLDTNSNIIKVIEGPIKHTCLEHEKVVFGPEKMVIVPPRHYVIVENPVVKDVDERGVEVALVDENGQFRLQHGDTEVRFEQEPFALYPGEKLSGTIKTLKVIPKGMALRLAANRDFYDEKEGVQRVAGDEWLFFGPATFYPKAGVEILCEVYGQILKKNEALRLRARNDCIDIYDVERKAGEEYVVQLEGLYIPTVSEDVVYKIEGIILTQQRSIHVKATQKFYDEISDKVRKAGSEWLITREDCDVYIPNVNVEITNSSIPLTILSSRQYCVVSDPVDENGKPQMGTHKYIKGPATFFLQPGEYISASDTVKILGPDMAYEISANESFFDEVSGRNKRPGDKWVVTGPTEFWPPMEARINKHYRAFLSFESLNLYFFSPAKFFAVLFVLVALLIRAVFG